MPFVERYWPAVQLVQAVHANTLVAAEYLPDKQLLHIRSDVEVPFAEINWPLEQRDHDRHWY